ncbi:MAG: hypothetical protein ABI550_06540 [Ignavibacteriaceae bacterium]
MNLNKLSKFFFIPKKVLIAIILFVIISLVLIIYFSIKDSNYRDGILIEFTGVFIETLLILILLPIIKYFWDKPIRYMAILNTTEIYNSLTDLILELFEIDDFINYIFTMNGDARNLYFEYIQPHSAYGNLIGKIKLSNNLLDEFFENKRTIDITLLKSFHQKINIKIKDIESTTTSYFILEEWKYFILLIKSLNTALNRKFFFLDKNETTSNESIKNYFHIIRYLLGIVESSFNDHRNTLNKLALEFNLKNMGYSPKQAKKAVKFLNRFKIYSITVKPLIKINTFLRNKTKRIYLIVSKFSNLIKKQIAKISRFLNKK